MANISKKPKEAEGNGCTLYKKCGGCQLQNLDYESQLAYKQTKVMRHVGGFCHIEPIIGMENPLHYRNKVQAAFGVDRGGKIISGVYQSSTHKIVPVSSCMIENELADRIIVTVRTLLKQFHLPVYDETKRKGLLRHVLVKCGFATGEVMVVLVVGNRYFPQSEEFVAELLKCHPEITTVILNTNDKFTSLVLGEQEEVLWGKGYIEDVLCGYRFRISAKSFYQINPVQTEILYQKAIEFAGLTGKERVLDAYCGIGTIGMIASKSAKEVLGVELNKDAVRDARENAKLNGIGNISFLCRDATDYMKSVVGCEEKPDVVLMDPPRAGSTPQFIGALAQMAPKRVVYVSCNPETLGRDLYLFKKNGYKAKIAQPVDMFPHTNHVETVVLTSRTK